MLSPTNPVGGTSTQYRGNFRKLDLIRSTHDAASAVSCELAEPEYIFSGENSASCEIPTHHSIGQSYLIIYLFLTLFLTTRRRSVLVQCCDLLE